MEKPPLSGYTPMKTLVIDVGGTHVKLLATERKNPTSLPSGPELTTKKMVADVLRLVAGWKFDRSPSITRSGPERPAGQRAA